MLRVERLVYRLLGGGTGSEATQAGFCASRRRCLQTVGKAADCSGMLYVTQDEPKVIGRVAPLVIRPIGRLAG